MGANLYTGDSFTDRFNDTSTFVSQNDREGTLWVYTRQGVSVSVTDTSVKDFNSDFVGSWRKNLDLFDRERLSCLPGDSSFTGDGLG